MDKKNPASTPMDNGAGNKAVGTANLVLLTKIRNMIRSVRLFAETFMKLREQVLAALANGSGRLKILLVAIRASARAFRLVSASAYATSNDAFTFAGPEDASAPENPDKMLGRKCMAYRLSHASSYVKSDPKKALELFAQADGCRRTAELGWDEACGVPGIDERDESDV